jgi:hypothetical protein
VDCESAELVDWGGSAGWSVNFAILAGEDTFVGTKRTRGIDLLVLPQP